MTTELIKTTGITLNGDKITAVNARDLWKFLESKIINGENKGRFAANEYFISLDMAKELAMVENNERGRQARQYFIEVKKRGTQEALRKTICAALTPNYPRK